MPRTPLILRESVGSKPTKVDWSKGIIYGVKVLAEESRNGFIYPQSTRVKAHRILEGLRVNIDHLKSKNEKDDILFTSWFGKLINVREGKAGTFADLKFNVKHLLAESICYAAEELDDTLGMSINGRGLPGGRTKDGKIIVGEITRLRSCDVVADPGSTVTLFESAMEPEELNPEMEAAKAHVNTVMMNAKTVEELKAALASYLNDDEEEEEVKESLNEEQQLARLTTEKACLKLCESLKVEPSSDLIDLLADLPTEEKRKALIAKVGVKKGVKPPKSAPIKLRESAPATPATPADPAAERARLANILRRGA